MNPATSPAEFKNPYSLGNKVARMVWAVVWFLFFRTSPRRLGQGWRCFLLKLFGAKVGKCWFHPRVRIWAPWKLEAGDHVFIDEGVWIYNAYGCRISDRVTVSADSVLCSVTHDYTVSDYPLIGAEIVVDADVWITMRCFVMPGVHVGEGAVVGAQSVVTKDVQPWTVVAGNPARFVKNREIKGS